MGFQISKIKTTEKFITLYPYKSELDESGKEKNALPAIVDESIRQVGFVCVYPSMKVLEHLEKMNPTRSFYEDGNVSFVMGTNNSAIAKYFCHSIIKDWTGVEEPDGSPKPYKPEELYDLFDRVPSLYQKLSNEYRLYGQEAKKDEDEKQENFPEASGAS